MTEQTWNYWGASVIGPSHIQSGIPNQDCWMARRFAWSRAVVVSDGLGSKPHADIGSKAACSAVLEAAKYYNTHQEAETTDFLRLIHTYWLFHVAPFSPLECSSTCLFAIQMGSKLLLGRLGDGMIVACSNSEKDSLILSDSKSLSFSNITDSLHPVFCHDQWEVILLDASRYHSVLLCTDGISDDLEQETQWLFAQELYANYKDMDPRRRKREITRWLKDWPVPFHTDDKTIACLFKQGLDS